MQIDKLDKHLILYDYKQIIHNIYDQRCIDLLNIDFEDFIQRLISDFEKLNDRFKGVFTWLNIGNIYKYKGNNLIFLGCINFKGIDLYEHPFLAGFLPEKLMFCFKLKDYQILSEIALPIRDIHLIKVFNDF